MDPVKLIVSALAAGAASAMQDGASAAVKQAYGRLRDAVKGRLAGQLDGELVLTRHEADPEAWQAPLSAELSKVGAGEDAGLQAAAQALMELVGAAGSRAGKYSVMVSESQAVQIGDHNTQKNTFGLGSA